jgi:cell division protein FtsQ
MRRERGDDPVTEPVEPAAAPDEPATDAMTVPLDVPPSESEAVEADSDQEPEFEGPRRRERRERAERREAQARARAIEDARLEAKRRTRNPDPSKADARGSVRGLKMVVVALLAIVAAIGLGLILYFTPLMAARNVLVIGTGAVTQQDVLAAAQVRPRTPLLQINTDEVADRVATIRQIASARVQREYPSTLRITITERIPVAVKDFPDGPHLYDRDGVDFATGPPPPALPYLDVDNPGPADAPTKAALEVLTSLRPDVASQVGRVAAPSVASITLTLTDGRVVVWGTNDRTDEKAEKLGALLTQPGHTYDVSSPDLPTVK